MDSTRRSNRLLSMTWRDVFFAHWPVDPAVVEPTLPDSLTVDTDDHGNAWLSIVGFVMDDIRPRFVPVGLSFPELNLRTYVRHEGSRGIYFYNLDADDRLGVPVARRLDQLPYYRADQTVTTADGLIHFESHRTHEGVPPADFDATIEPDASATPRTGAGTAVDGETPSVSDGGQTDVPTAFLVERYRFFATDDDGTLYYGDIDHEPWEMQDARMTIRENTLFEAAGFEPPDQRPHVQYAESLPVTAGRIHRLSHSL